jgi:hypothetical protein
MGDPEKDLEQEVEGVVGPKAEWNRDRTRGPPRP